MEEIFGIKQFNTIEDEENYYFFRALNMADNSDVENNIILDKDEKIKRIRTDRERYDGETKYDEDSKLSLEQVFDHIKMHYRKDTNCISLSSNANISVIYGRGSYKDKYVLVKVPKKEMGEKVINAGQYMLEEIQKQVDKFIETIEDEEILKALKEIDRSTSEEELLEIIKKEYTSKEDIRNKSAKMRKGITYRPQGIRISSYKALNEEQVLEKNKIIAKLTLLERKAKMPPLMPQTANNNLLVQTIGNAFSSMELIHYGEIQKEEIIEIPKEIVDIFALIQQVDGENKQIVEDLKRDAINAIESGKEIPSLKEIEANVRDDITIDDMYELTDGRVEYGKANSIVKNMFYLSKGQLHARRLAQILKQITNNNPKYTELIQDIASSTFRIEPAITTRLTNKGVKISESVSLNLKNEEIELIDKIKKLSDEEQQEIIENGGLSNVKNIISDTFSKLRKEEQISKEQYYAEAIVSLYDWHKIGIEEFTVEEKNNLLKKIQESNVVEIYKNLEEQGIDKKQIPTVLLNTITGKQRDLNEPLSIERIERFLGYYDVENTEITLRPYQQRAVDKTDEIFEENRFASVILPTGGGKSFVAISELMKHQNEEILYLAPQNEILEQMKDYIIKYVHGPVNTIGRSKDEIVADVFPKLKFSTYPHLLSKEGEQIVNKQYDFIVLDELHRTGAQEWGSRLDELLENQTENTKVLGITATPRRDSDGKNMATEIARKLGYTNQEAVAGKHIAMNMSLTNAIRMGLVVNPKLVSCVYNLKEDGSLDELKYKIEQIKDIEEKNEKLEHYEALRRNIENADGISKVLQNNVKKGGKYIVFLPIVDQIEDEDGNVIGRKIGKDKISEYEKQIMEYFKDSDIKPNFHSMLGEYGDKENEKRLEEFQNDSSDSTDFMLVMNKANEGLHLNRLDGIIWLRPLDENSKILYLQQLGRVISSEDPDNPTKDEDRPVVIDLVNNTLKVNWDNVKTEQDDIELLNLIIDWSENHDGILPNINSSDREEVGYASVLKEIQENYKKYLQEDFGNLNDKQIDEVKEIIELGNRINLWQIELTEKFQKGNNKNGLSKKKEELGPFEISELLSDFIEFEREINNRIELTPFEEVLQFCREYGRVPKASNKKASEQTEDEKREFSLYRKWKNSEEKKIVDKYTGKKLEEIPKDDRELVELMRSYGYSVLPFEEVLQFCRKYGRVPRGISKARTEEEKREKSLYQQKWRNSEEKKIVDKYEGKKLEEIPKDDRELVELMRSYGYSVLPFEEVLQFCRKYGRVPSRIKKKASEQTEEEKREQSLYNQKWKNSEEKKIVDKYKGKKLEEIPKDDRELVELMRSFGYGIGITRFEEVLQFCREYGRVPRAISKARTEEEKLYTKWKRTEEKKIVDKYEGKKLEEIPKDDRELVELMRSYGYGVLPFEEILQFYKENGRLPKASNKKASEQTEDEKREQSLYRKWERSEEKKIVDKYEGKKLEEIPEEHRELVKLMRSYGYSVLQFEEVLQFCRKYGRVPSQISKKASEQTEEEKKIVDKYKGKKLEEIPEEHRELVKLMRSFGYYGKKLKGKDIAQASISLIKDMDILDREDKALKELVEQENKKEGGISVDEQ